MANSSSPSGTDNPRDSQRRGRLDDALALARRGLHVVPVYGTVDGTCACVKGGACKNPGKHPSRNNWPQVATTDEGTIRGWFRSAPRLNVGVACGAISHVVVVDVDPRHDGDGTLAALAKRGLVLPETATVATGGGGSHMYFRAPVGAALKSRAEALGPGVDLRAEKGLAVAPGSIHASGQPYSWSRELPADIRELPLLPDWIVWLSVARDATATWNGFAEGRRNQALLSLGGRLRRRALVAPSVASVLQTVNAAWCTPPLDDAELAGITRSVEKYRAQDVEPATNCPDTTPPWTLPVPLETTPEPPAYPVDALSGWLAAWVTSEAVATQTPPDVAAMFALASVATCVAPVAEIEVRDDWVEPLAFYAMAVLPSGSRKSAVCHAATAPLRTFENRMRAEMEPRVQAVQHEIDSVTRQLRAVERKRTEGEDHEAEIVALREELSALRLPTIPRLFVDDCTPEQLVVLMEQQGGCMAVVSAEGGAFDNLAGRYRDSPSIEFALKAHAGDPVHVDRASGRTISLERPRLVIAQAVQPQVLQTLGKQRTWRNLGLLARILFHMPTNLVGRRIIGPPPVPAAVQQAYRDGLDRLLEFRTDALASGSVHRLRFDGDADALMRSLEQELEPQLGPGGSLHPFADWGAKLAGAVARIAAVLHFAGGLGADVAVSGATMERAARIGRYLLTHAEIAFALAGVDPDLESARHVLAWLERGSRDQFTLRDAYQALRGSFTVVAHLRRVLLLLTSYGYARLAGEHERPAQPRVGRPKSPTFESNPIWLETLKRGHR